MIIYTAIFGGYDDLKAHPDLDGVRFVAFTDDANLEPNGWEIRYVPSNGLHPRDQAKEYKLFPHRFFDDDTTIWIDGSHEIINPDFPYHVMASLVDSDFALYEHPWRDCIYDEADASIVLEKYQGQPIVEQVAHYRAQGHPEHAGLYACGTLARRSTPAVTELMEAWADEIEDWSYQDQLSLPVVCRRLDFTPATFPLHQVFGNTWTAIQPHHRSD